MGIPTATFFLGARPEYDGRARPYDATELGCGAASSAADMNTRADHAISASGEPDELVRITADVVFHRDVLGIAAPGLATAPALRDRLWPSPREAQLALDFLDGMDEDPC